MAEITSSTPVVIPNVVATVVADVKTDESKIVAFVKAHWAKTVTAVMGFAAAHFGVIAVIVAAIKKVL